ncbi:MAG: hypothetical protein ACRDCT_04400, partial [Shewanella sp.]
TKSGPAATSRCCCKGGVMSWSVTCWHNKPPECCTYKSILTLGWGFFIGRKLEMGSPIEGGIAVPYSSQATVSTG